MKQKSVVTFVIAIIAVVGCGPSVQAPVGPGGQKVMMQVVFDRGLEGKTDDQINQLDQLGEYMGSNLVAQLNDTGYAAQLIGSKEEFAAAPGKYLLFVKVVNYNPGSKAARMLVGFGAGTCTLDLHFELYGQESAPLISTDHGRASSWDWDKLARKLNEDLIITVTDRIK